MKTIRDPAIVLAIAFSTFAFAEMLGAPANAGPIVPRGRYCMTYDIGGSDCSFTSYTQCLLTASGIDAECYGKTVGDHDDGQNENRNSYARARGH